MRRALWHHAVVLPITNTPAAGSGAGVGQFSHWPHPGGGASSTGISTTAARSPAVRAGTGDANVSAVAATVAAAADAASCCGPVATVVARGGSPIAAALPAARDALDDRHIVGTDVSDLSALAGARVGTTCATLRTRKRKNENLPSKSRVHGENTAYLKLEKPRFHFLEGSGGAVAALIVAAVALADAPAALAGAPVARAGTCSTNRPAVGASTPTVGACSTASSAAHGDGGGGFHLSEGARPPSLSSSSSSDDDEFSSIAGGRALLLAQPVLLTLPLSALPPPDSPLIPARRLLLFLSLRGMGSRPCLRCRRVRPRGVYCHHLLKTTVKTTLVRRKRPRREGSLLTAGASGSMMNNQTSSRPCGTDRRLIARLALVAAYS
jgi:hypothetical protein